MLITLAIYWFSGQVEEEKKIIYGSTPFLRVTNREYSLFLWQNPEFMRQKIKQKRDYLEAWGDGLTVDPKLAESWVQAPHEALFLYHTWHRLLGDYYYPRQIPQNEFLAFLKDDPQWHPTYWKKAPGEYKVLLKWIQEGNYYEDLKELSYEEMPKIVRQAFQGWKNFTMEGEKINQVSPTYRQLWTFIEYYDNFRRPFWINLVRDTRPDYLKRVEVKGFDKVPDDQMDGLLKMGIYNYLSGTAQNPSG